jgi:hypothetical protein
VSESVTEQYIAEIEAAELEAAGLFQDAGPDGAGLDPRATATIKRMRGALKRHRGVVDSIRAEAIAVARAELVRERQTETSFRRLGVPPGARALFSDLDPTDRVAMDARADELRQAGVSWPDQPRPPGPPAPDPNLVAQRAMQAAAAGAVTPESAGDLATRLRRQAANPAAYSDSQRDRAVDDFNAAVNAAARTGTSGALG